MRNRMLITLRGQRVLLRQYHSDNVCKTVLESRRDFCECEQFKVQDSRRDDASNERSLKR